MGRHWYTGRINNQFLLFIFHVPTSFGPFGDFRIRDTTTLQTKCRARIFFSIKLASFIFISFRINAADRKSRRYRFCMKPWHWHGNRFSEVILLNVEWPEYENNTVSIYIECTRNRCNVCCCRIVSGSNSFAIGICYFALDRFLHRFMLHRGGWGRLVSVTAFADVVCYACELDSDVSMFSFLTWLFCSSWPMLVFSFDFLFILHSVFLPTAIFTLRLTRLPYAIPFWFDSGPRDRDNENESCLCQINVFVCFTWHRTRHTMTKTLSREHQDQVKWARDERK